MLYLALSLLVSIAPANFEQFEASARTSLEHIQAPQLTDASTIGLETFSPDLQFSQGPIPPSTTPPTCQDLANQIAALEAEITQLQLELAIAGQQTLALQELYYYDSDCEGQPWNDYCSGLFDDIEEAFKTQGDLIAQINAKRAALQALLGLLAVYC